MDSPVFLYFLKVNLAIAILYMCYRLLFQSDTFFRLRRFTLLSVYLIAFLYQLPDISNWLSVRSGVTDVVIYYSSILPKETVVMPAGEIDRNNWTNIAATCLQWIYLTGVAVLLFRCLAELTQVVHTWYKCKRTVINGVKVCLLPKAEEAYSFFGWIFIYPQQYTQKVLNEILLHEETHARQIHSLDMIVSEIINIFCWINPFVWMIKQEICINNEYQADQEVMYAGYDKKEYQYHLIGLEHPDKSMANLYNNFSVLPLKKRISMLNKKRTNSARRVKYLALLPLVGGLLLINNIDAMARLVSVQPTDIISAVTEISQPAESIPAVAEVSQPAATPKTDAPLAPGDDKVYEKCDVMPEYPGGQSALLSYLCKTVKYPVESQTKGEQGKSTIKFIVNKDGSISDAQVIKSCTPLLDAEALRVVKLMPKWTPGKNNGKAVRCSYTVPVTFRLQ